MISNQQRGRVFTQTIEQPPSYYWHPGEDCKAFWGVVRPYGVDVRNYLFDPGFEGEQLEWITEDFINGGLIARSDQAAFQGGFGLRVVAPPAATQYEVNRSAFGSTPIPFAGFVAPYGQRLYGSIWVRAAGGDTVTVCFEEDGNTLVGTFKTLTTQCATIVGNGQWQQARFSTVATYQSGPVTAGVPVQIRIVSDNGSRQGFFDIDAGYVGFSEPPYPYFDGDSEGASWLGAPHASQSVASRFSRVAGNEINFSDLGLDVFSDEGWGYPDVENLTSSYARLDGAQFQRQKLLPRTIRISFDVQTCIGCSGTKTIHQIRQGLMDALGYRFRDTCNASLILTYQPVNDCCKPVGRTVRIPAVYSGGLEGSRKTLTSERITIEFTAYDPVVWTELEGHSVRILETGIDTDLDVGGDVVTYPIIRVEAGPGGPLTLNRIQNLTTEADLAFGVPTVGYVIPANSYLLVDTDPTSFSATLIDAAGTKTSVENQINFAQSNIQNFRLVPGGVNTISFDGTAAQGATILMFWNNRWLSADGSVEDY